jgi:hypothetical protein
MHCAEHKPFEYRPCLELRTGALQSFPAGSLQAQALVHRAGVTSQGLRFGRYHKLIFREIASDATRLPATRRCHLAQVG